jgi:AraC family transcriptional regulator
MPPVVGVQQVPATSEPFLAWILSGEADFQEREGGQQRWTTHRVSKGDLFLTTGGGPYEVRWRTLTAEPFESLAVFLELPLLTRALEEVFGADAPFARLRDGSGFRDDTLDALMTRLHGELLRHQASALVVQGIGQVMAIHLARHHADLVKEPRRGSASLPGYKLRQVTDWMRAHLAADFDLAQLAALAGLSKFHFHRLFRRAVGLPPSRFHLQLRLEEAKRLLRETRQDVMTVGLAIGYTSPSHFAQVFRRETGLSPSDYRRQR